MIDGVRGSGNIQQAARKIDYDGKAIDKPAKYEIYVLSPKTSKDGYVIFNHVTGNPSSALHYEEFSSVGKAKSIFGPINVSHHAFFSFNTFFLKDIDMTKIKDVIFKFFRTRSSATKSGNAQFYTGKDVISDPLVKENWNNSFPDLVGEVDADDLPATEELIEVSIDVAYMNINGSTDIRVGFSWSVGADESWFWQISTQDADVNKRPTLTIIRG